ncbi:hypothetical protein FACS1894172_21240 [Spirochaetia bacterium]|nr:hypothetical protein FACS1894172_21240 [Spirochaetia bacterium]
MQEFWIIFQEIVHDDSIIEHEIIDEPATAERFVEKGTLIASRIDAYFQGSLNEHQRYVNI